MIKHEGHVGDGGDIKIGQIAIKCPGIEKHPTHVRDLRGRPLAQVPLETESESCVSFHSSRKLQTVHFLYKPYNAPVRAGEKAGHIFHALGIPARHIAGETGTILKERAHRNNAGGIPARDITIKGIGLFEHAAQVGGRGEGPVGQVLIKGGGFPEHGVEGFHLRHVPPEHGGIVEAGAVELEK